MRLGGPRCKPLDFGNNNVPQHISGVALPHRFSSALGEYVDCAWHDEIDPGICHTKRDSITTDVESGAAEQEVETDAFADQERY
jgi:hypothetical protein